jgi:predicted phosphodiesterase
MSYALLAVLPRVSFKARAKTGPVPASNQRVIRLRRYLITALIATGLTAGLACDRGEHAARPVPIVEAIKTASSGELTLPNAVTSVKFAVIGDSGRGTPEQHAVAAQMVRWRESFKYNFVLMLGDNIYEGPATPEDYRRKFEDPYKALLEKGVRFFAVLGNHDDPRQVHYPPFNMKDERYYSFAPPEDPLTRLTTPVEFFALDSTNMDGGQLAWLDARLTASRAEWKVAFLHHPLYTSGRYRNASRAHRWAVEPILTRHGVNVVLSGHEHIYQRTELQNGVLYFVSGGAGSLRPGDGVPAPFVARSYDEDYHFMLMEIEDDALHFQVISRAGETIDAGTMYRDSKDARAAEGRGRATPQDRPAPR